MWSWAQHGRYARDAMAYSTSPSCAVPLAGSDRTMATSDGPCHRTTATVRSRWAEPPGKRGGRAYHFALVASDGTEQSAMTYDTAALFAAARPGSQVAVRILDGSVVALASGPFVASTYADPRLPASIFGQVRLLTGWLTICESVAFAFLVWSRFRRTGRAS